MANDESLRITRLEVGDFKGLRAVDITREGRGLVLLRGKNGAGKTAILDSIEFAVAGGRASPEEPIRRGADKATVCLVLSDSLKDRYRITATSTRTKSGKPKRELEVIDLSLGPDGVPVRAAQTTLLDGLVGAVAFDPLAFIRETNAEKRLAMLVSAAGISEAWDAKNAELDGSKNARKDANAEVKRLTAVAKNTADPSPGETLERVDPEAAIVRLRDATALDGYRINKTEGIKHLDAQIGEIRVEQSKLVEMLATVENNRRVALKWLDENPAVDTVEAETAAVNVENCNSAYAAQVAHIKAVESAESARKVAQAAESRVDQGREALRSMLAESPLAAAIDGLSLDEDAVPTINGIHLDGCSGTEKLLLSAQIAMLANPKLRVMCVDEADALDADSIEALSELAKVNECDVWMTVVWAAGPDDAQVVDVVDGRAMSEAE